MVLLVFYICGYNIVLWKVIHDIISYMNRREGLSRRETVPKVEEQKDIAGNPAQIIRGICDRLRNNKEMLAAIAANEGKEIRAKGSVVLTGKGGSREIPIDISIHGAYLFFSIQDYLTREMERQGLREDEEFKVTKLDVNPIKDDEVEKDQSD
jgi:hypothetical protein